MLAGAPWFQVWLVSIILRLPFGMVILAARGSPLIGSVDAQSSKAGVNKPVWGGRKMFPECSFEGLVGSGLHLRDLLGQKVILKVDFREAWWLDYEALVLAL